MTDPYGLLLPVHRMNLEREEMTVEHHIMSAKSLANDLEAMEPGRYEVTFFGDRAQPINGVIPGRWHIVRRNDLPSPDSYIPLVSETGGYREPGSGDKYKLLERDLWSKHDPVPVKKPPKEYDSEGRAEELASELRAAGRIPGDGGMKRRRAGAGGKKK